jgi:hypothetical protein
MSSDKEIITTYPKHSFAQMQSFALGDCDYGDGDYCRNL